MKKETPSAPRLVRIGLTGGVGSGKSCVAELFRSAGVDVVNLDQVGRELTDADPEIVHGIEKICGPAVMSGGKLDRTKVREEIFSDPKKRSAIEKLLHPRIWEAFETKCLEAVREGKKLVICEAALLIESAIHKKLDGLILVTAPEAERIKRVMERDRIPALLVEKMIRSQLGDAERRRPATVVIENRGSLADLAVRVGELLDQWRSQGLL